MTKKLNREDLRRNSYPEVIDDMEKDELSDKRDDSDLDIVGVIAVCQLLASSDPEELKETIKCYVIII